MTSRVRAGQDLPVGTLLPLVIPGLHATAHDLAPDARQCMIAANR